MTKYVVGFDDSCEFIYKSLENAQEFLLSIAEECLYDNWYIENCTAYGDKNVYLSPTEFIQKLGKSKSKHFSTDYGWALYNYDEGYWIEATMEVD